MVSQLQLFPDLPAPLLPTLQQPFDEALPEEFFDDDKREYDPREWDERIDPQTGFVEE